MPASGEPSMRGNCQQVSATAVGTEMIFLGLIAVVVIILAASAT